MQTPEDPVITTYADLSAAATVEEVMGVTRAFLASWTPEELASLPAGCRPSRVHGPQDIEQWADRLLLASQAALLADDERRLDRLTTHFLIASVKLRQVQPTRLAA